MKERQKAVKEADKWFSKYIRERDKFCYCGKPTEHCGHLLTRANYSTRWDEDNANGSCAGCNMSHEYRPSDFTLWYIKRHGLDKFELLVQKSHMVFKITNSELGLLASHFKEKYEKLKEENDGHNRD
jgi:uncharacterized protein YlbG (UPF0298 family)